MIVRSLDPSRSVVVEACAGSGKTWLLASRVLRLLLAGVAPGEILAITFTRKAASEIEERVVGWLQHMATCGSEPLAAFLAERGVDVSDTALRQSRDLYERVLTARLGLTVNTFHGWFLQLLDAAPLSANLAGAVLREFDSRLFDELWQSFAAELAGAPQNETATAFVRLIDAAGTDAARRMMRRAFDRRSEWFAVGGGVDGGAAMLLEALRDEFSIDGETPALEGFFAGDWLSDFQAYLGFLESSDLKTELEAAARLNTALADEDAERRFAALCPVLLTAEGTIRQKKPGAALEKRFTPSGAERFLALHSRLGERLADCLERRRAERILAFNRDAFAVFVAFLRHVDAFKKARRQIDFVDAEWHVLGLLREEETAAFLLARLDARYRHVLLDEFQDTNPLQWQILRAWFAAYSDAERPRVFLVGDPKQSIYRFRRAEPKLFSVAADFLEREYGALRCTQDVTRRNASSIIEVVNALFTGVSEFAPFRRQHSHAVDLPGRVELLPLCGNPAGDSGTEAVGEGEALRLRDPLREPDIEPEDRRLRMEAERLAEKIGEMVGRGGEAWLIEDRKEGDGAAAGRRPLRFGDIMLLVRTRGKLAVYERALAAAGIPFEAGSRGGLLQTLEARDMMALLEFLVTPMADLSLAHALRSPLFACSDDDLLQLAARPETGWWRRLEAAAAGGASARLTRAARLLSEWLLAADRLPVHDLLDSIFHCGEAIERYRQAVPEAARAGVEANLRALLLLALDLDGGRYPSLPRFIDELRELRAADLNDAPDEGEIENRQADAGRVRILSIHGAKGLEAPVVWLLGANASPRAQDAWDVLVDWPPEDDAPRHFSFFGRKEERGAARQRLFDAEAQASRREELNLLYVAITRARQVFIASGIENARENGETPYGRLKLALESLGKDGVYGDALPAGRAAAAPASAVDAGRPGLPTVVERRAGKAAAERFGMLLHALLERRTAGAEPPAARWWAGLGFDEAEYRRALPVAERILAADHLRRFFEPTQYLRAWNEVDLKNGAGQLQRIDRLVETGEGFWVIDYKSSRGDTARLDDYCRQVAGYCAAVAEIFPGRTVRGALVFSDTSMLAVDAGQAG